MMVKIMCPNGHTERFQPGMRLATAMAIAPPVVNGDGVVIREAIDWNTYTTSYTCLICGAEFALKRQAGRTWLSWQDEPAQDESE